MAVDGVYFNQPGVDPWPESRDARKYDGPHAVVAHPPCARWCRLAAIVEKRWGHKRGEDGGCFKAALASVRHWGGVLEHPAYSDAWAAYGLTRPSHKGGWSQSDDIGWTCHVEQGHYGHLARKATWLYAVRTERPGLPWGPSGQRAWISQCNNHNSKRTNVPRLTKKQALATPLPFRDLLLSLARSVS